MIYFTGDICLCDKAFDIRVILQILSSFVKRRLK